MKITVSQCRDCARPMIADGPYQRFPVLRSRFVRKAARGLCVGCYSAAFYHGAHADQTPRERRHWGTPGEPCRGCGRPLTTKAAYEAGGRSSRQLVARGGLGMCTTCYMRAWRRGTLPDPAPQQQRATTCRDCGQRLASWSALLMTAQLHRGYVRPGALGMCGNCYGRAHYAGTLPNPAPRRAPKRSVAPKPRPAFVVGARPDDLGPNDAATVARLRAAIGLPERHSQGEVTV